MSKRIVHCHQCGSKMLERRDCKTCQGLRARLEEVHCLMREVVRDFHGKTVLFSSRFLDECGAGAGAAEEEIGADT